MLFAQFSFFLPHRHVTHVFSYGNISPQVTLGVLPRISKK